MSKGLDFSLCLTMQLVINFLKFLDTCSLHSKEILPLSGANTSVTLAVVSSLREKSVKLGNNK